MSKKVLKNTLHYTLLQMVSYVMPLILVPYVSRTIGVERYGVSEFALELGLFFGALILFGFDFTMSKKLSRNRDDKSAVNDLFWKVFYSRVTLALVIVPGFLITCIYFSDALFNIELILITAVFVCSRIFSSWWFFQGQERIKEIAYGNLVIKAMLLAFVLFTVKNPDDYPFVVMGYGLSQITVNFLSWLWLIKQYDLKAVIPKLQELFEFLGSSAYTFVNELLIMAFGALFIIMVKQFLSEEELGLYAATMKVVLITQNLVIQSMSKSLFPNLALISSRDLGSYLKQLKKFRNILGILLFVIGTAIWLGRELIVQILFGENFSSVSDLIPYIAFLPLLIGMTNIYGWQGLYILNQEKVMALISSFVILFTLTLLLLFTDSFGLRAVLLIRVLGEFLLLMMAYYFFRRNYHKNFASQQN